MNIQIDEKALQAEMARRIVDGLDLSAAVAEAQRTVADAMRRFVARPLAEALAQAEGLTTYDSTYRLRVSELTDELLGREQEGEAPEMSQAELLDALKTAPVVPMPPADLSLTTELGPASDDELDSF